MEENQREAVSLEELEAQRSDLIQTLADAQQGTDTPAIYAAMEALAACQEQIDQLEAVG